MKYVSEATIARARALQEIREKQATPDPMEFVYTVLELRCPTCWKQIKGAQIQRVVWPEGETTCMSV